MPPAPDFSSSGDEDRFLKIVGLFGDANRQSKLRSRCQPTGRVSFSLDPEAASDIAKTAAVQPEQVASALDEAAEIATVVLREETDQYVQFQTRSAGSQRADSEEQERDGGEGEEGREEAAERTQRRIQVVTRELVTDRLRERFNSVLVAKHDVFASVDWEVSVRAFDAEQEEEAPGPSLVIELQYGRPRSGSYMGEALRSFFSPEPDFKRVTFQCDEEDVKELISTLDAAQLKLMQFLEDEE